MILFAGECVLGSEIYGTVTFHYQAGDEFKSAPVGDVAVELFCPDFTASSRTDRYGNYRFGVPDCRTCELRVHYRNQAIPEMVISYAEPARFDATIIESQGRLMTAPRMIVPRKDKCQDNMKYYK
jgi:hypothetical protein